MISVVADLKRRKGGIWYLAPPNPERASLGRFAVDQGGKFAGSGAPAQAWNPMTGIRGQCVLPIPPEIPAFPSRVFGSKTPGERRAGWILLADADGDAQILWPAKSASGRCFLPR